MNCPKCKRQNPTDAVYCENCGHELAPAPKRPTQAEGELWRPPGAAKPKTIMDEAPKPAAIDPFRVSVLPQGAASPGASAPAPARPKQGTVFDSGTPRAEGAPPSVTQGRRVIGWIVTFTDAPDGLSFVLREGRNTIGRDLDRDIVLTDATVSGKHACIQNRGGHTWLFDERSANGTFLNGEDIQFFEKDPPVNDGDVVRLGGVTFLVRLIDPVKQAALWGAKGAP